MPEYLAPGVFVEEVSAGIRTIEGVTTSTCGFVGVAQRGPINQPVLITSLMEFYSIFGRPLDLRQRHYLGYAVEGFFREGGSRCYVIRIAHYDDILDGSTDSLTADFAAEDFIDQDSADVLTVRAANQGEWGLNLNVAVINSSRLTTTLVGVLPAGAHTRLTLQSTDGINRGTMLWIVRPIFATITYDATTGNLQFVRESLILDADDSPDPLADGFEIPDNSLVMSPDFRFMANLSPGITLAAGNVEPVLTNLSNGITENNEDVFGNPLAQGATVWVVPPDNQSIAIVDHIEGNEAILAGGGITTNVDFPFDESDPNRPLRTKVLTREYNLVVRENNTIVETFESLSTRSDNRFNFADNRINLGIKPSRYIRVAATSGNFPMRNATFTNLGRPTGVTNLDGLVDINPFDYIGSPASETGIYAFDAVGDINILVVPYPNFTDDSIADTDAAMKSVIDAATNYCENRNYLFCIIDCKPGDNQMTTLSFKNSLNASNYAAYYYPWLQIVDPQNELRRVAVPPSGFIAGLYAFTDKRRGVHKAPAGITEGKIKSAAGIERIVSKGEQDGLNRFGVNVIRNFSSSGLTVWGARTISASSEWTYINVRRLFNFIEKSIDLGTQWVVFEPNDPKLWKDIERTIKSFLRTQWRSEALFGDIEDRAFHVKCDAETNTPETIELGQVITEVAIAPVKPAEFVIFRIIQAAAGSEISE